MFFNLCYIMNVVTIITGVAILLMGDEVKSEFLSNPTLLVFRGISLVFLVILWIKCLIVWSKKDKGIGRFLLLFFLHGLYTLFYYPRAIKQNWI